MGPILFRERLLEAIAKSQKTEARIAADAGFSIQALGNYKDGRLPKMEQAIALAAALETTVGWLLGEATPGKSGKIAIPIEEVPPIKTFALDLMGRIPDDLAEDVAASPKQVREWKSGKAQPSHRQLALLFNELTKAAAAIVNLSETAIHPPKLQGNGK